MSAVLAPVERTQDSPRSERPSLRALDRTPARLSTIPFVVLLVTLLGAGMVGILLLNVNIQQRARTVAQLQASAEQKGFQEAALTSQVHQLRSSTALAQRAWELGLRPNTSPAFLVLPSGTIVGDPTRVGGNEAPDQKYRSAEAVTSAIEKANERAIQKKKELIEAQKKAAEKRLAEQKAKAAAERAKAARKAELEKAQAAGARASAAPTSKSTGGQ